MANVKENEGLVRINVSFLMLHVLMYCAHESTYIQDRLRINIIIIYLPANGLSPGGSGYYACT
jgi:hypothetical protein